MPTTEFASGFETGIATSITCKENVHVESSTTWDISEFPNWPKPAWSIAAILDILGRTVTLAFLKAGRVTLVRPS